VSQRNGSDHEQQQESERMWTRRQPWTSSHRFVGSATVIVVIGRVCIVEVVWVVADQVPEKPSAKRV
jgi:hypothetical protein